VAHKVSGTTVIDNSGHCIIGSGTTRPSSPVQGMLWFNTSTNALEGYNGTSWVILLQ